ncbi:hypothetical protein ACI65C_005386 [Semiaphis heraclei]
MSDPEQKKLNVSETHKIKHHLGLDSKGTRGGLIFGGEYVWFTNGADIVLYSKTTGRVESSRYFDGYAQTDNSIEITFVQELHNNVNKMNILLVGCSSKSFGILFVCQLPTLMIIRCIHTPSPITYISTINNESLAQNQLSDGFKVMSTILLVGLATGEVFAVDLRKHYIENQFRNNEIVENGLRPSKLLILRKNKDIQEAKRISDHKDFHLAMFINEHFCNFYKKECSGELNFGISCLLYIEEINAVAIGYITGHFQLWDCEIMKTLFEFKNPECSMPITHITFLEQADQSNKLCYLWIIQSDNSILPNAMMIALSYEHRTIMSNGHSSYRVYKDFDIKLKMSLRKESGIGRCISALTSCNGTLVRKNNGVSENFEITLFAMLMEIRKNVNDSPKSYIFLFDINQWCEAKMPSLINNLKVSNSYATFVKLPDYASYLDFNIYEKTLHSFGSSFRNNIINPSYLSSIYFECDCLLDTEIIRFKHVGVQPEVLNELILKNGNLFLDPNSFFAQCLRTNLRPSFWDKTYDYKNCSSLNKLNFVVSILLENNLKPVFEECALKWIKEIHCEVITLHLVKCLWNHIKLVKQYADELCVPLFDCSGTLVSENNISMLNDCLSQMLRVENLFKHMQFTDCIQITKLNLRETIMNSVTQYFSGIMYFLNIGLLPKQIQDGPTCQITQSDFTSIIQYASKRRKEFGDLPLYLIDAIITNEPNGNKLIEQWKHECIEETKGLYPPSDVQCLLRIYLNAELSNLIKDFITIYFLIDVCSVQKMDEKTANIFYDDFIKNNELYKLCCASWLFDHDMFESWNWYHWTVLKLFVFKKQYHWAQIYLEFFDIKLVNLDDHKFYVNLQIMNNNCYDALCYVRKVEEKKILFEYIFERCLHTSQLKAFLNYSLDSDEKKFFYSYLKKFKDTKSIQFMFLVQEKRYYEAVELCKSLKDKTTSKNDNIFKMSNILVGKIKDNISPNNKNDLNKNVFSNKEIKKTFMNSFVDNQFNMMKSNTCRGYGNSCQINLIVPNDDIPDKTQVLEEKVSIINGVLNPTKFETVKQIEDELLKLLDTPFIQNVSHLPSITNRLAVPKKKSAKDNEQLSMTKLDETPQTLTFYLPDYNDNVVEKFSHKEGMSMKKNYPKNENVGNNDSNNLPINMIANQTLLLDNTEIEMMGTVPTFSTEDNKEYENMDISDNSLSDVIDGENGDNLEDSYFSLAVNNEDNLKEPDIIYNDANDCHSSEQSGVLLEGGVNANLEESDFILGDDLENCQLVVNSDDGDEDYLEESCISLDGSNDTNYSKQRDNLHVNQIVDLKSDQFCVMLSDEYENNLEEPNFIPLVYNENNLKEPDIIFNDANDCHSSEQSGVLLEGGVNENLEESDFILGDDLENCQLVVNSDDGDEDYLEESCISLDGSNDTNYSKQRDNLHVNQIVDLKSDQFCVMLSDEYENNLEEPNFIPLVYNENNLKEPDIIFNDANDCHSSEQSGVLLEGGVNENLEESDFILGDDLENCQLVVNSDDGDEDYLEESCISLDGSNDTNYSKQRDNLHVNQIVDLKSDQFCVMLSDEYENNLEEPNFIPFVYNENNLKEPDIIFNDANDCHSSKQSGVILEGGVNENLEESDFILGDDLENCQLVVNSDDCNEDNLEKSFISLDGSNDTNYSKQRDNLHVNQIVDLKSDQFCVMLSDEYENNLEEPNFIPFVYNENNLKEPDIIFNDANDCHSSEQSGVILEGGVNANLEESDFILGDDLENCQLVVNSDYGDEDYLEESCISLDGSNDTNYSKQRDNLHVNQIVDLKSDQFCVMLSDEYENNLEEPNFIPLVYNENNLKEPDIIFNDANDCHSSEQSGVLLEGGVNENLEESDFILGDDLENCQLVVNSDDGDEDYLEESCISLDGSNDTNYSKQRDNLHVNQIVDLKSDQFCVMLSDEYENNLEEPNFIPFVYNENNLKEPDIIFNDANDCHSSKQSGVILEGGVNENLEESDFILGDDLENCQLVVNSDDCNEDNLEKSFISLDGSNDTNYSKQRDNLHVNQIVDLKSDQFCVMLSDEYENNLEEPNFIPFVYNENNLKEPDIIFNDANDCHSSEQSGVILEGGVNANLEESDFILGDDLENCQLVVNSDYGDEDYLEESCISLDGSNDTNYSKQRDNLHVNQIVDLKSDQFCVMLSDEYENNLEEPNFIPFAYNENNLKEPDIIFNDANDCHSSEQSGVILEGGVNGNLEESDFILGDGLENYNNLEEPNFITGIANKYNLKEPDVILKDANDYNNSEQSDVILEGEVNENVDDSYAVLDNDQRIENHSDQLSLLNYYANYNDNSEKSDVLLENSIDENLDESSDVILDDDQSIENQTDQFCVIPDGENEKTLEKSYVIPNDVNEDNLNKPDIILHDDKIVKNHSNQLSAIPDDNNEENSAEPNVTLKSENENSLEESVFILKGENYKVIEEPNTIFDDNDHNNSKQSDKLLDSPSVPNHLDKLNVIPNVENENSLVSPDVMLDCGNRKNSEEAYASEQNLMKSSETLMNKKTADNNDMVIQDDVIYPTDSQSNTLENCTLCIYCLPEDNHSNDDNQIIEEDNTNYICNKVDGKKTSFTAKKDDTGIISRAPNNFQIDENHKEDLCNDQNEDCLYDEYQFSNNDILSELSSSCQEFNHIPEDSFSHHTMTGNESNQLEMYKTLNQPTSVLLNESFSSKINLSTAAEVNEIPRDLVVDKSIEIVTNEISKDFKPSSSNINVNTINILNNATREYSVEIQNSYPAASSQLSKTLNIEEFPVNSMICNDILAQEETSKLDSFVSSSSETESGKHLAENLHSFSTNDKNKQLFIEPTDKNIPNLRKRRNTTKFIPDGAESMSKKRSKCQKQIALKRRKVSPKSTASIFGASNDKIDSEQISRESTKITVKKSKKIEELLLTNLSHKNKKTVSQEKLKKIAMPVEIKQDSENSNKTLNQNFFSYSKMFNQLFYSEPKVILSRNDVSLYKNCLKKIATVYDSGQVSSSINETNSHIPIALKRLRSGCLKSMKEPPATNTLINLDEKPKKDSNTNNMNKVVSKKSDKVKKVKFDKILKPCLDPLVMNCSKTD